MTKADNKSIIQNLKRTGGCFLLIFAVTVFSVKLSPRLNYYIRSGLTLCFEAIIGSAFPFMILGDVFMETEIKNEFAVLGNLFERTFKINRCGIPAFVLGTICGFPLGVKISAELCERSIISREECERLIALSCNMGPAFIISGIGAALCKSVGAGIAIYLSSVISTIISGMIFGIGKIPSKTEGMIPQKGFSLTGSIKKATVSTLNICGFIVFFSGVCGLVDILFGSCRGIIFLYPFVEVANASKTISAANFMSDIWKYSLLSFSVSFSGASIALQTKSFVSSLKISMKRYFMIKLFEGVIAALITFIFFL